jgi:TrkA domain protein
VPVGSPYDGRPLSAAGGCTGATVVAVVRGRQVTAAPDPGFVLHHDDVVVAVGDRSGVAALTDALAGRPDETP